MIIIKWILFIKNKPLPPKYIVLFLVSFLNKKIDSLNVYLTLRNVYVVYASHKFDKLHCAGAEEI